MTAIIISHPVCLEHLMPDGHPECPARLEAIHNQLLSSGLDFVLGERDALEVTDAQLARVHDPQYLHWLNTHLPTEGIVSLGDDIFLSAQSLVAARYAAGSGAQGVDLVMQGTTKVVFCNVRPPGHHAERARAMGFCLYNNIAVAAYHALDAYGLKRVAIVDFDVHHGNGTQDIFLDEPRVLFCSSFQYPFYPDTDIDIKRPNIVNVPLPATTKGPEFQQAINDRWLPALEDFAPELILVSSGFDAHLLDDMSSISLTERDYQWVSEQLRAYVDEHEQCRGIVSMLEGGYDLPALGRSVVAHVKAMAKL
ncbi:histone deacetylase family protein [uncultured Gilvimarinus sp.]|uniref:histone deacetylase family protein n=1 Tax=uncultured Gilvimarinus sp. TaxID=1689143 RepID=UPI0030EEDFFE|tara:strand:- start:3177 stop:4103 length:927 start_codon:yes stop_codon:yes gene_type:complete